MKTPEEGRNMLKHLIDMHNKKVMELGYFNLINNRYSQEEIAKNFSRDISYWQRVALDIISIEVNKTEDTDDYVLHFQDSKGNKVSLWLRGNILRTITPY